MKIRSKKPNQEKQDGTKACPECKGNIFHEDHIHSEVSCASCGLVLVAPPCYGFVFPGFQVLPRSRSCCMHVKTPMGFCSLYVKYMI